MQSLNNSITVMRSGPGSASPELTSAQGDGEPNPTWIPVANAGRQAAGRERRRHRRRHLGRPDEHPDDRALHRRLRDRRLRRRPASSTPTTACTAIPGCTSSTARRCRRTSASTRRCRSPRRPSGRCRCGRTRASMTSGRRWARRYERLAPIAPKNPAVPEMPRPRYDTARYRSECPGHALPETRSNRYCCRRTARTSGRCLFSLGPLSALYACDVLPVATVATSTVRTERPLHDPRLHAPPGRSPMALARRRRVRSLPLRTAAR